MNFHLKHLEINTLIIYSVLSPSSLDQHLSEVSASKLIAWTNSWIMNMATIGSGKPDLSVYNCFFCLFVLWAGIRSLTDSTDSKRSDSEQAWEGKGLLQQGARHQEDRADRHCQGEDYVD